MGVPSAQSRVLREIRAPLPLRVLRQRAPDDTYWMSRENRAFLDGVLAAQGYRLAQIEPPDEMWDELP